MAKVAILYEVLGRSKGGIEAWIYHASEELIKRGDEVTIFHTMVKLPDDAAPAGVKFVNIPNRLVDPSIFFLRSMFNSRIFLKDKLDNFDAIWVRSFRMAWVTTKVVSDKRTLYINAAPYAFYTRIPLWNHLKSALKDKNIKITSVIASQLSYIVAYFFEKKAIKRSTNIFLSKERKRQTLTFFKVADVPGKSFVIPAGVDTKRFMPSDISWDGKDPFSMITVCRLTKDKNVQCILEAIKILKKEGINSFLTIVGEGSYFDRLKSITRELNIQQNVSFVGRKEDIQNWYIKNDIFVLPSLYEGFGSVYIEAMACGLPCIAISNSSGKYSVAADEIIDHGKCGFLMKNNDPKELSLYIKKLFNSPDLLEMMSKVARQKAISQFSWKETINKIIDIK
jgi:glycosyltransferase involved in cell wall biosynthesis